MQAQTKQSFLATLSLIALAAFSTSTQAQLLWTVATDDNAWPMGLAGGAEASFVQENGSINPLPGSPESTSVSGGADNDYYFAGVYSTVIEGNGDYAPVDVVSVDEEAAERAFAGGDLDLRYHFNLPDTVKPTDLLSITFDALNLDTGAADPRFGVEVYFNGVRVQSEILIRPAQLDTDYTTVQFTAESVKAQVGPGFDNIVSLRGVSYNSEGGGNWLGIDYVRLDKPTEVIPPAVFPWAVGLEDDAWPAGDGGGANATFVQENGSINALPGSPTSTEAPQGADNDYYFAGSYATVIPANGDYQPVGTVPVNEEAAERAFAAADNELRYHFNLPNTLRPDDLLAVTFDALNLDESGADPRYGVEVYFNGVRVQPEVIIRGPQLDKPVTTPQFTLASVNAQVGPGFDNIVTLKGINYNADGGGNWMGIDYIQLNPVAKPIPLPVLPWAVGLNDNGWPTGNGGGPNTSFVQEAGVNPLPGNPNSPEVDQQADDDYYFAGVYSTVIPGNGNYQPVGEVRVNEEAAERAFAGTDNDLRYHFNLPASVQPTDMFSIAFDALNLDTSAPEPRYGIEIYFNGVKVQPEILITPDELGKTFNTAPFTAASVNAAAGPGFDNIVALKGINKNADGGGNWMGIDYLQLNPVLPAPFPWAVGKKDNGWPAGNGGGANATFVQESGVNPLPGNPNSPEVNGQADDDYYFAGEYTTVIAGNGEYEPVGVVLVNEEAAERAFAGSDNDLRYHFNLPTTLKTTDQLMVTFAANNLDTSGGDPQYGIEVYFNGVLVQPELLIRNEQLNRDFTTAPFTLASVDAKTGPGFDNIVSLKGINKNADGGGNWMGIDFVQLNPMPTPVFPLAVGRDDNAWPVGTAGGPDATFVQEAGVNELPGNPSNLAINGQADDDYYFAGVYSTVIAGNGDYQPVGIVPRDELTAERAFAGTDNDLRYHFNLPSTLLPTDTLSVTFDALNLQDDQPDPRYGVEVYFNGVLVQPEVLIRAAQLDQDITTRQFTLASVNAKVGTGFDNVVSLKGINYNADGGGNWMGIDYLQINGAVEEPLKFLPPAIANGKLTLNWTGSGNLESASNIRGPWSPVLPAPAKPYAADIVPGQTVFYRLRKP